MNAERRSCVSGEKLPTFEEFRAWLEQDRDRRKRASYTELYLVCPETRMPVSMGGFPLRCIEERRCVMCQRFHVLPYLNGDRRDNLKALQAVMPTFIDQAANDCRDQDVAAGAARFMAHEAIRLRTGKGMSFASEPGASEGLYSGRQPQPKTGRLFV
jgi:hypothetical protein